MKKKNKTKLNAVISLSSVPLGKQPELYGWAGSQWIAWVQHMGLINTTSPQVSGNTLPHTVVTISRDWTSTSLEVIHSRCVQVTDINKHELTVDPRLQHPTLPTHSYSTVYPFILGSFTHYIRNYLVLEDFNQELAVGFRFCFLIYCLTNKV